MLPVPALTRSVPALAVPAGRAYAQHYGTATACNALFAFGAHVGERHPGREPGEQGGDSPDRETGPWTPDRADPSDDGAPDRSAPEERDRVQSHDPAPHLGPARELKRGVGGRDERERCRAHHEQRDDLGRERRCGRGQQDRDPHRVRQSEEPAVRHPAATPPRGRRAPHPRPSPRSGRRSHRRRDRRSRSTSTGSRPGS